MCTAIFIFFPSKPQLIDKLYTQIGNVNRLHNIIEPFAALFWALGIVLAQCACTAIGDPARLPGIPQSWYWHGNVRQGSVRFN